MKSKKEQESTSMEMKLKEIMRSGDRTGKEKRRKKRKQRKTGCR